MITTQLTTTYDSTMRLLPEELQVIEDTVDRIVDKAIVTGNPLVALRHAAGLRRAGQVAGVALAKLLYEMRERWESFSSDDKFADVVVAEVGISYQTYNKYVEGWEYILEGRPNLWGKPIGGIILLNASAKEGLLSDGDWDEIDKAPDVDAIRAIVKRVRGLKTSASMGLYIMLEADGTLKARKGGGPYVAVGFIKRDNGPLSEAVIARFERSAGVLVKPAR